MRPVSRMRLKTLVLLIINFLFGSLLTILIVYFSVRSHKNPCFDYITGNSDNNPPSSFSRDKDSPNNLLLVLIISAPNNIDRRNVMRQTWLKLNTEYDDDSGLLRDSIHIPTYNAEGFIEPELVSAQQINFNKYLIWLKNRKKRKYIFDQPKANIPVVHRFVIGADNLSRLVKNQIMYEEKENQDILLIDGVYDSYGNLTRKLLLGIESVVKEELNFKYLLKCDDDTYVKLGDLLTELEIYDRELTRATINSPSSIDKPKPELYWGYFNGRANVKLSGKWKEENFHSCDHYLPYALGGGYVISRNLAKYLTDIRPMLVTYVSEDISMGVWLTPFRNIYRKHDVRFDTGYMPRACNSHHLVLHKRDIMDMRRLRAQDLCTHSGANDPKIKRPNEYYYAWTAMPTKCCDIKNN